MADHVGELDDGDTGLELLDYESMTEIIDLGSLDACNAEVAVDCGSDVANQERVAGFGDKESRVFGFGPLFDIFLNCRLGGLIEGNFAGVVGLIGSDFEVRLLERDVL